MTVINTFHKAVPTEVERASLLIVLVGDDAVYKPERAVAAYMGIVDLPEATDKTYAKRRALSADFVAARGTKLRFVEAKTFFPGITEETYRA